MKVTKTYCDVCKKDMVATKEPQQIQVIFTSYQEDGHHSDPYLDTVKIDLCSDCKRTLLSGKHLFASGAMGHNSYWFKKD